MMLIKYSYKTQIKTKIIFILCLILLPILFSGCSTLSGHHRYSGRDYAPDFDIDISKIPNAVPKVEPLSKYGNPSSYVVDGHRYYVLKSAENYDQTGIASWYGMKFYKQRTSSGEPYNVAAMTAASKVLPLPTFVRVTNLKNKKTIIVKVNDRGPFHANRIIDLSYVAAAKLGVLPTGTALVEVKAIDPRRPEPAPEMTASRAILPRACLPPDAGFANHSPKIYLQLGAFSVKQHAENLEKKIRAETVYPVFIKTGEKNNLLLYRVQIGPISNVENTDKLHDNLEQLGLGEPMTVIE